MILMIFEMTNEKEYEFFYLKCYFILMQHSLWQGCEISAW